MIEVTQVHVYNFDNAIRGMRNPLDSWDLIDSRYEGGRFVMGPSDLKLARRLVKGGTDHRKFMRQILVSMDIEAPLYWWKEFDTYKVGTVANSTSTMHTIHKRPITPEMFSTDGLSESSMEVMRAVCSAMEKLRVSFLETKDKAYWDELIRLMPASFNQKRTVTMNYENLLNMYRARKNHKLSEWRSFCEVIAGLDNFKALIEE